MAKKPVKSVSKVSPVEVAEVVEKVSKLAAENIVSNMGKLQVEASAALADLSGKIVGEVDKLNNLKLAIQEETNRLQKLYDVEAGLVDLEEVRAEIANERESWENEKAEEEQERLREEELYQYNTNIKRRNEADKIAENHRVREADLVARQNALKAQEAEVAELRKTVDGIPALLKKEVDAAVAIATNSLKKDYENRTALVNKDIENLKKEHEFAIRAVNVSNEQLHIRNEELKEQVASANARAESVAIAALNSQSGKEALRAVQQTHETLSAGNSGKR